MRNLRPALLFALVTAACSSDPAPPTDAGVVADLGGPADVPQPIDLGAPDVGTPDAGPSLDTPAADTGEDRPGPVDTGEDRPEAATDAGMPLDLGTDARAGDGGTADAATDVPRLDVVMFCGTAVPCSSGLTCCGTTCVDPQTAVGACGGCDRRCAVANASPVCRAGVCGVGACTPGFGDCDGVGTNGCEVDTGRSLMNCGGCGIACPARPNATAACAAGACGLVCRAGFGDCDGNPVNGCEGDVARVESCGACGVRCSGDRPLCAVTVSVGVRSASCAAACVGSTPDRCGDACVNLSNDPSNCGECGTRCGGGPDGIGLCAARTCSVVPCAAGSSNCDGNPANGCEVIGACP